MIEGEEIWQLLSLKCGLVFAMAWAEFFTMLFLLLITPLMPVTLF